MFSIQNDNPEISASSELQDASIPRNPLADRGSKVDLPPPLKVPHNYSKKFTSVRALRNKGVKMDDILTSSIEDIIIIDSSICKRYIYKFVDKPEYLRSGHKH